MDAHRTLITVQGPVAGQGNIRRRDGAARFVIYANDCTVCDELGSTDSMSGFTFADPGAAHDTHAHAPVGRGERHLPAASLGQVMPLASVSTVTVNANLWLQSGVTNPGGSYGITTVES